MNIVLTGGGTAGHVTPNLALLPYLKAFTNIYYIGSKNGIEKTIISKQTKIKYKEITTVKFIRSLNFKNFLIPFKLIKGINESKKILKEIKPDIIFSKGGFVAVPVVIAGKLLKIPIVAHESDYSIGLANKIIYKFCNKMCFTFNNFEKYKTKGILTGTPIRDSLFKYNSNFLEKNNFDKNRPTICIMGGSLGAKAINEIIFSSIKNLTKNYNIIHIVGKNNTNKSLENIKFYKQFEYMDNIQDALNNADLIISRAGSNTIFELLHLKKPMILIPLPKGNSRGDQVENAEYFKSKGFANIIKQENLTKDNLLKEIRNIMKNKNFYLNNIKKSQIQNPNKTIYNIIINEIKSKKSNVKF